MHARNAHILAVLAAFVVQSARADAPAATETMAERRLKDIAAHQTALFADAVTQGNALEQAGFKTQVLPVARAGASFHAAMSRGKFQGMI